MNVLLLNPITRDGIKTLRVGRCQGKMMVGLWPNIEYGFLFAMLQEDGFDVHFLDANHEGLTFEEMLKRVEEIRPDLLFVLSITATLEDDLAIGERLASRLPETRFIYWGTHATVRPEDYLKTDRYIVIRREPEETGLDLCRALRDGVQELETIPGVSYRTDGKNLHAPDRPFSKDLDDLPIPAYREIGTGSHLATDTQRPFALIKTSRGCPQRCAFCTVHAFHGARWRPRSPEKIIEEIRTIRSFSDVDDFFFQSDLFSKDRAWTVELCERLIEADFGITWFSNSRVDTLDEDLLRLMKRSGCRLVALGVESGSDQVLSAIHKGTTAQCARRTIEACKKAGLPSLTYWVFGLEGETPETIDETLRFIREVHPDYAHFYSPTPLPGSRLYKQLDIAGQIEKGNLTWRDFFQGVSSRFIASTVSRKDVEKAISTAYLQFYTDPRRILRELSGTHNLRNLFGKAATLVTMIRNYVIR